MSKLANSSTVNGGWGEFGDWEDCPVSCNGGKQKRLRACDSPTPAHGGDDCTIDGSNSTETQNCNENHCPSKQSPNKNNSIKLFGVRITMP